VHLRAACLQLWLQEGGVHSLLSSWLGKAFGLAVMNCHSNLGLLHGMLMRCANHLAEALQ
jgi:hypothetical protein